MAESWEETKKRLKRDYNIGPDDIVVVKPKAKRDEPPAPVVQLYEIRKVTLPPNKKHEHGKVVVYGVTLREANWWIEHRLKPKVFHEEIDGLESKTLVFYEKFPIDGTPRERSIYANPAKFCTEDFPDFPRRVN